LDRDVRCEIELIDLRALLGCEQVQYPQHVVVEARDTIVDVLDLPVGAREPCLDGRAKLVARVEVKNGLRAVNAEREDRYQAQENDRARCEALFNPLAKKTQPYGDGTKACCHEEPEVYTKAEREEQIADEREQPGQYEDFVQPVNRMPDEAQ